MIGMFRHAILFFCIMIATSLVHAQESQIEREVAKLPWQSSPATGRLGSVAQIRLNSNFRFLDAVSTSRFLVLNGNSPRENQYTVAPRSLDWFAIFGFENSGYVKDDETLDPNELLRTLKQQNQNSIAERRRLNLPILRLEDWAVSPHYDVQTRRLEWGTRLVHDDGSITVNYTIRLLSRSGMMSAILVSNPETLGQDVQEFRSALRDFDFVQGQRYSEFRQGDHVAEYGLAALIVGGAAAAAAKSGLLKGLGKFVGIAIFGGLAALGAIFKKIFGHKKTSETL